MHWPGADHCPTYRHGQNRSEDQAIRVRDGGRVEDPGTIIEIKKAYQCVEMTAQVAAGDFNSARRGCRSGGEE